MNHSSDTMDTVRSILVDTLGIDGQLVYPEARLREDLALDSADTVDLALELERRLGVAVKIESRQELSLTDLCALLDGSRPLASAS